MSYSSTVPRTAVVRVEARSMIFTVCGVIYGVIMGSHICIVTQRACHADLSVEVHDSRHALIKLFQRRVFFGFYRT